MTKPLSFIFLSMMATVLFTGCASPGDMAANLAVAKEEERIERLRAQRDAVVKYFRPMKIQPMDWLETQPEKGETFDKYILSDPTLPTAERRTLYILPIGKFTAEQRKAIGLTGEYMKAFYGLPVKPLSEMPLGKVPKDKQRKIAYRNNLQIRTSYFLDDVLPKKLPADAAALIAFTNYDLYPSDTWAFVFGQASLENRIGVWSLYRFADPKTRKFDPDLLLMRTLKIAMHETGHMFSMSHCIKYECLMSGTNHVGETDRRPLDNCPECMAKLAWATGYDPAERYERMAKFWQKNSRLDEAKELRAKAKAVRAALVK